MRMSTAQVFRQSLATMLQKQADLNHVQQQLGTGKRLLTPSDDPVAAVQVLDITDNLARLDQYGRNINTAKTQLALEESVLKGVGDVLQRVRALAVQANNAAQNTVTRKAVAVEVRSRIDELLNLANTRDASDEFIFAGFQSQTQPFVRDGVGVQYRGDAGQRQIKLADNAAVTVRDSGRSVFMSAPSGNGTYSVTADSANTGTAVVSTRAVDGSFTPDNYTLQFSQPVVPGPVTYEVTDGSAAVIATGNYTSGNNINVGGASIKIEGAPNDGDSIAVAPSVKNSIFDKLLDMAAVLEQPSDTAVSQAALNNSMAGVLEGLDQSLDHVLRVRADVGTRMNHVDNQNELREHFDVELQRNLSEAQDLDYGEAITRMNLQLTALQAAQQTFVKTQGLSLFNYIS